MARSFPVGTVTKETTDLIEITRRAFFEGAAKAVSGNYIGDIGEAVQKLVEAHGFGVVRALVGHGIGRRLHEEPQIPNFSIPRNRGALLKAGMVLAIEPMVNVGTFEVETMEDNWTVVTEDGKFSAHYENTCVVREGYPEILTLMSGE
jgi:methionyl aminopeptidase